MNHTKIIDGIEFEMSPEEVAAFEAARAPVAPTKAELHSFAAEVRYNTEVGGTTFAGMPIATDRSSRNVMSQSVMYLREKPEGETVRWKGPAGWVTLDLPALTAATMAAGDHVNLCFAREDAVGEAIDLELITTRAEIDQAFVDVETEWQV